MPFSRSLPLLLCCLGAVSHGGSWQNVNLRDADLFSDHCLYRAQLESFIEMTSSAQQPSQMATQEIDALCQNVNWINQSLTDSSKFKIDCIYQVRLDNAYQWQQAYGGDTIGFDLYINPYIPSKVSNGVARTISWISKKDYITKEGSNSTRGTVLAMRYFCP